MNAFILDLVLDLSSLPAPFPALTALLSRSTALCSQPFSPTPLSLQHFPGVKTYVRAHDVAHGINLEKAGATAVIPEILEPSLQLAAAVLGTLEFQQDEVSV